MEKVRLADIAKKLGISIVTVHNALTGQKGVSDELRIRILETAEEMGYKPAISKRQIQKRMNEFKKIGVLIAENYLAQYPTYHWKMYQELSLAATEKKCYTTLEILKKHMEKKTLELPQTVVAKSVDGLIIIGQIDDNYIQMLKEKAKLPIVFLDFYDKKIANDAVVADNFYGMYLMTELLFEQGIEEIGFIGSIRATTSIMDRYCGFMKSMIEHGQTIRREWLIEDRDEMGVVQFDLPERLPKAFVCNCDLVAGMLILKLEKKGYRVPQDISVIGFDNYFYPKYTHCNITTYEVDTKTMAKSALYKLLKQLKNPRISATMEIVSGHIVMKESIK